MTTNKILDPLCRNVLVIEDDDAIRDAIQEVLGDEGYDIHTASNGEEGMRALETIPGPTLVLLDMMMPIMNGWQFIAAEQKRTRFADISVVVISAAPEDRALLGDDAPLPVEGLLRKPIDVEKLLKVVGQYCAPKEHALTEAAAEEAAAG